jgi:ribosomal protein L10
MRACVALLLCCAADALLPGALSAPRVAMTPRSGYVVMAGAKALAKKTEKLEDIRATMAEAQLMFCVRSEGLRVNEINKLRQLLPEGVEMKCVKNTLINLAVKDFDQFNADNIDELLHYSNFWFFASEDKMRESFKIWKDFSKDKVWGACVLVARHSSRSCLQVTAIASYLRLAWPLLIGQCGCWWGFRWQGDGCQGR